MKIELHEIAVRELAEGFSDRAEEGVTAFGGRLDIRPKYQREFIYSPEQQRAVIHTILKGFPLNTMYWAVREDGRYEIIDGQQRTLSACKFVAGDFSVPWGGNPLYFHNLHDDDRARVLDYRLMVYFCEGSDAEKLEWFRTINIAGEELTAQELRNAVYAGPWTADAKRYFSRTECPAFQIGGKYLNGSAIRQDYLETAIRWVCDGEPEGFMAEHQHDASASPLWLHFQNVITWVKTVFPNYRAKMKGLDWGRLHRRYGTRHYDPAVLETRVTALMKDDEVEKKSGIWEFLLSGEKPHMRRVLGLRTFTESQKEAAYERQSGKCALCGNHFELSEMQGDHIVPWSKGGKTLPDNLQMLCALCNQQKGGALA